MFSDSYPNGVPPYTVMELHTFMQIALSIARPTTRTNRCSSSSSSSSYRVGLSVEEVSVGCLLVDRRTKAVISYAQNQSNRSLNATRHCELVCVDRLIWRLITEKYISQYNHYLFNKRLFSNSLLNNILLNCDLFVTVEPCIMCTLILRFIGIRRVFFGCFNFRFGGCGSVLNLTVDDDEGLGHKNIKHSITYSHIDPSTPPSQPPSHVFSSTTPIPTTATPGRLPPLQTYGGIQKDQAIHLLQSFYSRGNPYAPDEKRQRLLFTN